VKDVVRTTDLVGRYGGEEFVVVCPGANLMGATALARRIRDAVRSTLIDDGNGGSIRVTASIGVASRGAGQYLPADEMIAVADRGLYAAKAAGRNAVRIGQDAGAAVA
jgi:diguanylate cyclase (GGDEF)-like protein